MKVAIDIELLKALVQSLESFWLDASVLLKATSEQWTEDEANMWLARELVISGALLENETPPLDHRTFRIINTETGFVYYDSNMHGSYRSSFLAEAKPPLEVQHPDEDGEWQLCPGYHV